MELEVTSVTDEDSSMRQVFADQAQLTAFRECALVKHLEASQQAKWVNHGDNRRSYFPPEVDLLVKIPFGTKVEDAVNLLNAEERKQLDLVLERDGVIGTDESNILVTVRGGWEAKPYINMAESFWLCERTCSFTVIE